jgi:hypothetical protein
MSDAYFDFLQNTFAPSIWKERFCTKKRFNLLGWAINFYPAALCLGGKNIFEVNTDGGTPCDKEIEFSQQWRFVDLMDKELEIERGSSRCKVQFQQMLCWFKQNLLCSG